MKNSKQQFEEAMQDELSAYKEDEGLFGINGINECVDKCESISDQQSLEFAKWLWQYDYRPSNEINSIYEWTNGERSVYIYDLFEQFKQEFYS